MTAEQQQVVVADLLGCLCKSVARCTGVGTAESAVGEKIGFIAAECQRLFQYFLGLRGTHRNGADSRAVLLLELHRSLNCVCVEGIYRGLDAVALEIAGFRVKLYVIGVGYLLNKYKNFHGSSVSVYQV